MKNNEIKEILDVLKDEECYYANIDGRLHIDLNKDEASLLLDYITNLQQKLEEYKDTETYSKRFLYKANKDRLNANLDLVKENERLKEKIKYASDKLVGYINASYVITNEYFEEIIRTIEENTDIQIGTNCMDFMEELEDYKSRCEKAISMLKELNIKLKGILNIGIDIKEISDIEDTLNGRSDE